MAVRHRIFNSTSPFSGSSKADLKGSYPSCSAVDQEPEEEEEEGKESKMGYLSGFNPLFNKIWTHGSAEHVGEMPLKTSHFIAQAECETQDSQEFSPSSLAHSFLPTRNCFTSSIPSEHNNVACPTTVIIQEQSGSSIQHSPKKKNKKKQRRKGKKKVEKKKEKQRQRKRLPSGVPEQESGRPLVQVLEHSSLEGSCDLSSSCCSSVESLEEQDRGSSVYSPQLYTKSSSCSPLTWGHPICTPLINSYGQDSDSDSVSSLGGYTLALAGLRGCVSQGDRCYAGPFFKEVERDVREEEDDVSAADSLTNEGIIFYNEKIQPVDSEYKEGREYLLYKFIKEGSFGEVHSAQDVKTGFKFAAKKINQKRFNSEEVGAWSALRSSRVVKLFGVIREGQYVILLMEHKAGSLGQLIADRGRLPEDLSLHYHSQVLSALEYLVKKKVVHLDIKADNVLLSEDGKETFLCDFGHAERLDNKGQSISGSRDLKGSETHMAPEIVKAEPRGAKADVWSSCCMLLHMLNGCQPWTRYYTCRLYLKIANEPPPLREIPPDCSNHTAEVLKAGLQKDPAKRASACQLKDKATRALREVGGLTSPAKGSYMKPLYTDNKPPDSLQLLLSTFDCDDKKEHQESDEKVITAAQIITELNDNNEEKKEDGKDSKHGSSSSPQMLISEPINKKDNKVTTVPELELRKLERDFYLDSLSQLHSPEKQEQLLSCLSSDPYSTWEPWDKKQDSGRWSLSPTDDFSSGVFSYNSQPDVPVFSLDLLSHNQPPPPCCFEGVDVCIRDFNRKSIRIRETRCVKVGHIATGISDQISERVFTLETQQGQQVPHNKEVQESGLELCCVPAPDFSFSWRWRIRDGVLETR